ncbi:MAG: penicillin-binding protein activator [Wenzhouxiangellaceae bacterium]|nr:penicillin-binding protein activator [Wenzhouxiangellaceae bacterium]
MKLLLPLFLVLLMGACAPTGPDLRPDHRSDDPVELAGQGRHAEAAERWLEQAALQPQSASAARLSAAGQWLLAGQPDAARDVLETLDRAELDRGQAFELDLLQAELALVERDFTTAGRILSMPESELPDRLKARYQDLLQRFAQTNPNSPEARVRELATALGEPDFAPQMAFALLLELPLQTLRDLRRDHGRDPMLVPWLDLVVAARSHLLNDQALDRALLDWQQQYPSTAVSTPRLIEWIQDWRQIQPMPESLAVLLPGQGPLVPAGEVLRDGLLAAWLELSPERRPGLDFYYLSEDPNAALGARFQAREAGHDWIVGPLDRNQIAPLLSAPDSAMSMLLLNRPDAGSNTEPGVQTAWPRPAQPIAMLALPPEEEAELAAVHALVQQRGRALVIAQQSDFGKRVAGHFIETFELGGGRVLDRVDYPATEFDHTDQLERLLRVDHSRQRIEQLEQVLGQSVESVPQRRTDVELVFLATRGGDAQQLIPQLRFLDLEEVPVYSTSHAYPGGDVGRDLDGIQMPISPWLLEQGEPAERRKQARRQFPALASSNTLSQLHALGRDALALLPWLEMMKRDHLLYINANVGRLRLSDGVVLERDLPWARIENGRPVRYQPQPDS